MTFQCHKGHIRSLKVKTKGEITVNTFHCNILTVFLAVFIGYRWSERHGVGWWLQGRTGTMICAYLLYKRMFSTAEQAIEFFHSRRMIPGARVYILLLYNLTLILTQGFFINTDSNCYTTTASTTVCNISLAEDSRVDCIQTCSPRVQVSTRVRTCIHYWRDLSGGRCRGSSATPFQYILIIDCQRWWPSFPGHCCTCLEQSARSCHFRTVRSSLPFPA